MIKVTWDDKVCIGAGVCVRNMPSVFQLQKGNVIIPDGAPEARVRKVITGALQAR